MIAKLPSYRATCDKCFTHYPHHAPSRDTLKMFLRGDRWRVFGNDVTCPDCIAKEEKR